MITTELSVNHTSEEDVIIRKIKKDKWIFPFTPLGKKSMRDTNSLDAVDTITFFTKGELLLLREVKNNINKLHEVKLNSPDRCIATAIRSWIKKGLIKRIKREHYIVNPYFITPSLEYQQTIKDKWLTLITG